MMIDHDMCAVSPGNASDSNQETPNDMRNGRRLGKVEPCIRHDYHVKNDVEDAKFIILGINAGGMGSFKPCGRTEFQKDQFFGGGDVVTTDAQVGDEEFSPLYQSARFGNFSYKFDNLEAGDYLVDLHFAEIVFTGGPSGLRIFDVFMQEEKV